MVFSFIRAVKRRSLIRDLTVGLTITIVFVTVIVSLLYYVSSTSSAEKRLESQALDHATTLSDILAEPLFLKDEAKTIIDSVYFLKSHNVAVVRVLNADGEGVFEPSLLRTKGMPLITVTKPVHWHDRYVGSVEVSISREPIIKAQRTTLYLTLMIMFSVMLSVITASWLLLKNFLTKPLAVLVEGIEVIAGGSYNHVIGQVNRKEIDTIIEKINVMASLIAARDSQLRNLIEELRISRDNLHRSLEETVISLASTTEKRDPYTAGHQERVNRLAIAIAKEQGLPDKQIEGLHIASLLHDIGKIALPAEYLAKPSLLSSVERAAIEHHAEVGYDILKNIHFPWPVAEIVYQHHEHLDGSGYPQGLTDKEILLEAKILTVADVVEAMSAHRPYRPSLGIKTALNQIRSGRGTLYHAPSVDACIKLIEGKNVEFSSKDWCPLLV